jgi:prophage regulatory protein
MDRFLRLREVCTQLGISRSTIYRMINDGTFPAPVLVSKKSKAWPESEITKYQKERVAASRPTPA